MRMVKFAPAYITSYIPRIDPRFFKGRFDRPALDEKVRITTTVIAWSVLSYAWVGTTRLGIDAQQPPDAAPPRKPDLIPHGRAPKRNGGRVDRRHIMRGTSPFASGSCDPLSRARRVGTPDPLCSAVDRPYQIGRGGPAQRAPPSKRKRVNDGHPLDAVPLASRKA